LSFKKYLTQPEIGFGIATFTHAILRQELAANDYYFNF